MEIIPVIDLKDGQVVQARGGDRTRYGPLSSPLSPSSEPLAVVDALLHLHPFATLYIADLDAIGAIGQNVATIAAIHAKHPGLSLWVDGGLSNSPALESFVSSCSAHPIIGSETLEDLDLLRHPALVNRSAYPILSLDYRGNQLDGPAALVNRPDLWPQRTIVVTLTRVGSALGPDFDRLASLRRLSPATILYAAGGVRDLGDIHALGALGIRGALVASALHSGQLCPGDLARISHGI
jgi:phosphoribosylformimino-5-aminoimidazole carboxamide ribotide isomerase